MARITSPHTNAHDAGVPVQAETIVAERASTHIDDETEMIIWEDGKVSIFQDYNEETGEYESAVFFKASALPALAAFLRSVQPIQ